MMIGRTMTTVAAAIAATNLTHVASTIMASPAVAVVGTAAAFNRLRRAVLPALPEELPPLEKDSAQFYGAVGGVLCSTLWDPGSSVNLITPEFAKELQQQ